MRLKWRIYYWDREPIDSGQMAWPDAPRNNVVAVVWQYGDTRKVEVGTPYYGHMHDWICRCWDPTLYLRKFGSVKFGRWTTDAQFQAAWRQCLVDMGAMSAVADIEAMQQSGVCGVHMAAKADEPLFNWRLYYDNGLWREAANGPWADAPSDGVLCGYYWNIRSGIKNAVALRRYTFYYVLGDELINTDDLNQVLSVHPQFKKGTPSFEGLISYRNMGQAIADAMHDELVDVAEEGP